ncbi:MAG: phosphopantetheine-binding protein [Bacteroidales bacterium]|jgi:acyl carrier protein|nr:phosphopantetheine-binding protein [Bacteroidales bacterium]
MNINDFIRNFADIFDDTPAEEFVPELPFKDLEEWSSLMALSLMSMVEDEYNVFLDRNDIENSCTVEDLFHTIQSK